MSRNLFVFFIINTLLLLTSLTISPAQKREAMRQRLQEKRINNLAAQVEEQEKQQEKKKKQLEIEKKTLEIEKWQLAEEKRKFDNLVEKNKQLLEKEAANRNKRIIISENLLSACNENKTEQALQLIKEGADIHHLMNAPSLGLISSLHIACIRENSILSKALIDCGANPSYNASQNPETPWSIVCKKGYNEVAEYMIEKVPNIIFSLAQNGYSGLHLAIQKRHNSLAEKIIIADKTKTLINQHTQKSLLTPLALATLYNYIDQAKMLLNHGAFVDQPYSENKMTPLEYAVIHDNLELAECFLEAGANPNIVRDVSYLERCCVSNRIDMAQLLVVHGADINLQTTKGISLLCLAVIIKNVRFLEILLDAGAYKNLETKKAITFLNCIESVNDHAITELFEERGISLISQKEAETKKDLFFETVNQNIIPDNNEIIPTTENNPQEKQLPSKIEVSNRPTPKNVTPSTKKKVALKSQPPLADITNIKQIKPTNTIQKPNACMQPIKYTLLHDKKLNWPRSLSVQQEENIMDRLTALQYITNVNDDITPLRGELAGKFRLRVGGHRIIFSVNHEKHEVTVHTIKLRKNVYK